MSYTVSLEAFHGPMDLLLYLVKKNEVEILDIPIAKIAEQFHDYLSLLHHLDMDVAGDFIALAADLMFIKSQMLLPQETKTEVAEAPDPRRDLVKQLLEYRKFKEAASALEECAEKQSTRHTRTEPIEATPKSEATVKPVELWDLVSAFARIVRETQAVEKSTIAVDDTPQHIHEEQILRRVTAEGRVSLRELFTSPFTRSRLIGLFLAILELIKQHDVGLEQADPFDELWVVALVSREAESLNPSDAQPSLEFEGDSREHLQIHKRPEA